MLAWYVQCIAAAATYVQCIAAADYMSRLIICVCPPPACAYEYILVQYMLCLMYCYYCKSY